MFEQKTAAEVLEQVSVNSSTGLSAKEAANRLEKNGKNQLKEQRRKTKIEIFLAQLNDPLIYILFAATGISIWHHEYGDAVIILAVVLINAIIGMAQESKAEAALDALKKMSTPLALCRRDGQLVDVPAAELVVGDIVLLEAGRIVPADLRIVSSVNLKIEESALTGESVPVDKDANFVAADDIGIGDRINMCYSSTSVAYGRGEGVVISTGMDTEIGKIAELLHTTKTEMTPLQKRLAGLGSLLGIAAIVICAAMFLVSLLQQRDLKDMMLTAISLAVAAVPEGLAAIVTIVLALGVQRLVKVNTIVRRLPSVETLGAVSVVCSDKTGTLTQNKMTVLQVYHNETAKAVAALDLTADRQFIEGFILCNDASIQGENRIGDPTELALVDMGTPFKLTREDLEKVSPRINEQAFDSDRKLMTTVHKTQNGVLSYTKGAMDNILSRSTRICINGVTRPITEKDKTAIAEAAYTMAQSALRVLGLALKEDNTDATETDLTFVGLAGMIDPPRPEAKASVATLKGAGVRTVMITGDHRDTALAIAKELGIAEKENQCMTGDQLEMLNQEELNTMVEDLRVFARVSPQHKVMIVQAFKSKGYIVSMTGDGVNDAPSLKAADIGVAMGITGTDVAKGAADMVLTDDNFSTIEKAVEVGRNIYANIRKSILFLLSSNFGEVISMFAATVLNIAMPLKAIHILWVNLVTDSLPGLALGVDTGDKDIMKAPPRKNNESLFANGGLSLTIFYGFVVAGITLFAFLLEPIKHAGGFNLAAIAEFLKDPDILRTSQTYALVTLSTSQLFHSFGMRNTEKSLFKMNPFKNKTLVVAFVVGLLLQVAVTEIPFLTNVFSTAQLSLSQWGNLLCLSVVPLIMHEVLVFFDWIFKKKSA